MPAGDVYIDFQGGSHGNFLEFVCNKFLGNVLCPDHPFDDLGTSHNKFYKSTQLFYGGHDYTHCVNSQIISVQISDDDLLPLMSISLLRAGGYNLDNNSLEINTYNKLNNVHYRWVLDNIIEKFFQEQISTSYQAVKDASWPNITCYQDFMALPEKIKQECIDVHNLFFLELGPNYPNCPRFVLREFFKIGFKDTKLNGFMQRQSAMTYDPSNRVFYFPYCAFYHTDSFINQVQQIALWSNLSITNLDDLIKLHLDFLSRQPYYKSKEKCDALMAQIINNELVDFDTLTLLEESYLSAKIELHYQQELPYNQPVWFLNSNKLFEYLNERRH